MSPMSPRLLRPRASGFSPRSISGLYLWLDGADSSSVTLNSGNVSQWRDLSGGSRHFSQSSSGAQPVYTSAGQNGKNCLTFDASRRLVSDSAASAWAFFSDGTSLYDAYIVYRTAAGSTTIRTILATGNSSRNVRSMFFWHDHRSGQNNNVFFEITTTGANASDHLIGNRRITGLAADVMRIARLTGDPSNATQANKMGLTVGTTAGTSIDTATGAPSAGDPTFTLTIGSLSNTSQSFGFSGVICEIIIFSRSSVLSAGERSSVSNYLTRKWGL